MSEVKNLLYTVCGDRAVYQDGIDLIDSGLLDSLAVIELFNALEDEGIELQPTRIDRNLLRTPEGIERMIRSYEHAYR